MSKIKIRTITKMEIPLVCPHCGKKIPVSLSEDDFENDLALDEIFEEL